jgi:site-specific recombinase XerD
MPRRKKEVAPLPGGKAIAEAVTEFLNVDRSDHTRQNYGNAVNPLAEWLAQQSITTLDGITYAVLNRYIKEVIQPRQKEGSFTGGTPNQYVNVIRGFFNWAKKVGYLAHSPATGLTIRKPKVKPPEARAMPVEVLREMLRRTKLLAMAGYPTAYALLVLLVETAHRVGAIATIKLDRIDLKNRRILVTEKGGTLQFAHFADPETAWAIQRLLEWRARINPPHDQLFSMVKSPRKPMKPAAASNLVARFAVEVCGTPYYAHSIRHLVATLLDEHGIEPNMASAKLGNTPEIYAGHYQPSPAHSRARQLADRLPFSTLLQVPPPAAPPSEPPPKIIRLWDDVG